MRPDFDSKLREGTWFGSRRVPDDLPSPIPYKYLSHSFTPHPELGPERLGFKVHSEGVSEYLYTRNIMFTTRGVDATKRVERTEGLRISRDFWIKFIRGRYLRRG